jgi:ATP-dependent DNA helicase RecQ
MINQASWFLNRTYLPIKPRKQWPFKAMFDSYPFKKGKIPEELRFTDGKALSVLKEAGWGQFVTFGKNHTKKFDDQLVSACVEMILEWKPSPKPMWVTCIPSINHPNLVPDFSERLARALNLPFIPCISKIKHNKEQKYMDNGFHLAKNLDGVFKVNSAMSMNTPCFLVDDLVDSRWTFTIASALLRSAGCEAVIPLALALNTDRVA